MSNGWPSVQLNDGLLTVTAAACGGSEHSIDFNAVGSAKK